MDICRRHFPYVPWQPTGNPQLQSNLFSGQEWPWIWERLSRPDEPVATATPIMMMSVGNHEIDATDNPFRSAMRDDSYWVDHRNWKLACIREV